MTFLIAGSNSFRQKLIKLRTDSLFCSVMNTNLGQLVPEKVWRALLKGGRELEFIRQGQTVYVSRQAQATRQWFAVIEGKLRVSVDIKLEENLENHTEELEGGDNTVEHYEVSTGEIFGGYWIDEHCKPSEESHIRVETMEATKVIELSGEHLAALLKTDMETSKLLLSRMAGKSHDSGLHSP